MLNSCYNQATTTKKQKQMNFTEYQYNIFKNIFLKLHWRHSTAKKNTAK